MAYDLKDYCGTANGWRRGCRCAECREAHRLDELKRRRMRGIQPPKIRPPLERFWEKVDKTKTCWLWMASQDGCGYGIFRASAGKQRRAHRWAYEQFVGPVPEGLVLDHLCRVRNCVNPAHLEPVTHQENMRRSRQTHCKRGHELTPDNVYWQRRCKKCDAVRKEERNG